MTQRRRSVRPTLFVVVVLLLVALSILATILIATPLGLAPNVPPWWGIPTFTLIAALGGSLLTGVFTTRNESKKRAHEVSRAQADRERDVGIRLATALENLYGKAYLDRVASDDRDAVISWRELQVVARGELVHAASLLMSAEYFFRQAAADYHGPPDANEEFRRSSNAYHYERIEFNNAMRIAEGQEPLPNSYSDPDNLPLIGGGWGVTRSGALIGVSPTPYLEWRSKASSSLGSPLAPSEAPPPGQASPKEGMPRSLPDIGPP
jgi:hypothetical protein